MPRNQDVTDSIAVVTPRRPLRRPSTAGAFVALALLAVLVTANQAVAQVQIETPDAADFDQRRIMDGLSSATAAAVAPDGRVFAIEKAGRLLWAPPGDSRPRRLLDLRRQVNEFSDRGLLGMALDSQFDDSESPYAGRLYLLYVHDPHGGDPALADQNGPATSRLTYVTVDQDGTLVPDGAGNVEHVVLDGIPAEGYWHQIGTVRADPDGTLWVGTGDATNVPDVRALEALDPQRMRGKIFHIDREGNGLPDHPFCPGEADLTKPCTKVFAAGFRNPFRFHLRGDGGLVVGDVGDSQNEELSMVDAGELHGWPCYEGRDPNHLAIYNQHATCRHFYDMLDPPLTWPTYSYPRTSNGGALIAGPLYSGDGFPERYRGSVFFGDFVLGWIRYLKPDGSVEQFATGWRGVQLDADAAGDDLISVTFGGGSLGMDSAWRITSSPGDHAPVARAAATPASGAPPFDAELSAAGSSDVDPGDELTYHWDLDDDGGSDLEGATVVHRYEEAGRYTPRVVVRDPQGNVASDRVLVVVGNPPKVELSGDETFRPGEPVAVDARAFDIEDGEMEPQQLTWRARLQHNTHFHEYTSGAGPAVRFNADPEHGDDSLYEVRVTATDSHGLTGEAVRRIAYREGGPPVTGDPVTLGGAGTPRGRSAGPDRTKPELKVRVNGRRLSGSVRDRSRPIRVRVSLRRSCRAWDGRRLRRRACARSIWLKTSRDGPRWRWKARRSLPHGTYRVRVRATDAAGNRRTSRVTLTRR